MRERVVLSVEDRDSDFLILRLALKDLDLPYRLYRVEDGETGLGFLRRGAGHEDAPRPDLIIANINMPKKNGLELLTEIKSDPSLKSIPVVMFTLARDGSDKEIALHLGASEFICKTPNIEELFETLKTACLRLLTTRDAASA